MDILEAVFVQSGYKVQATLICLYDIYPHLREHAALPAHPSYSTADARNASPPGSPETPLSRKREKPDATGASTSAQAQQPNGETPRKPKRTKPEEGEDDGEGEFVTVSYGRKKKSEPGSSNGTTAPPNKKVMDSEGNLFVLSPLFPSPSFPPLSPSFPFSSCSLIYLDIENAYQNYREQAIKAGEMRNLMFMQAAAAFQAGDGARARALSQRVIPLSLLAPPPSLFSFLIFSRSYSYPPPPFFHCREENMMKR